MISDHLASELHQYVDRAEMLAESAQGIDNSDVVMCSVARSLAVIARVLIHAHHEPQWP